MHLSRYLKTFPSHNKPDHFLLYSTLRGSLAAVPAGMLQAIQQGELSDPESEALARLGMLVADPEIEKEHMRRMLERANGRSRNFKVMVVLNLDCNLDCGYCYEAEFRGGHYMSAETADLLVQTLSRERIQKGWDVNISFYGGEPLLSLDLIVSCSEQLQQLAREHGVKYAFNLVTNGTLLTREVAQRLVPLGLNGAKFTLDGPPETHNAERPFASGADSFDAIVDNMAAVWDLVPINLGGNFREDNYLDFPRLFDHLASRGITHEKLRHVQFTPVTPQAGCSDHSSGCASSDAPWLVEALMYLREEILARGFKTSKPGVSACVVELEDNIVVNYAGVLYKCPAFMGWEGLSVGTLADGIGDYRASHCIGNWQKEECLVCCYLPLCFGGCRFLTLMKGNQMSDLDCKRQFLDATLERTLQQNLTYVTTGVAPA
ncbi:geopeptide radical SAM maturase [Citrifermentans bremense]|uniref:geopeptide radical SAM maturase n=1 Tax=Citrifermentans bremense TaxID=60035 RepID=UPI00041B7550|nr:geopeptide radical SAM maturase [Citrifermentans bremense]